MTRLATLLALSAVIGCQPPAILSSGPAASPYPDRGGAAVVVAEEGLEPPATVVVGEVVRVREVLSGEAEGLTHPARGLVSQP